MSTFRWQWLKEPLLLFLLLGGALFAFEALILDRTDPGMDQQINMTTTEIGWLADTWESRWQRPPTQNELRGLVDDYIRTEVLYRQALTMGLDRNDEVIRRRMVQKIEFMTEDLASQAPPSDAQLRAYLQENPDLYVMPERRSFAHIYFNPDQRDRAATDAFIAETLAAIGETPASAVDLAEMGDRFMLPLKYDLVSESEAARQFGQNFAEAVFALEPGAWRGPADSGYGLHLVYVSRILPGSEPGLDQVRAEVQRDYVGSVKLEAREAVYGKLVEDFEITIDEEAILKSALPADPGSPDR